MAHVPAGEFIMGNDTGNPDKRPQRRVYLDGAYPNVGGASAD